MSQEQILGAIANCCQNDRLIFQVIVQDTEAHIYINRQSEDEIDYFQLRDNIVSAVADLRISIGHIYLYSRVSGETEPDWQTDISLIAIAPEPELASEVDAEPENLNLNSEIEDSEDSNLSLELDESETDKPAINISELESENAATAETQIDLNAYCFIRNKRLLAGELVPPKPDIAQLIQVFHEFEPRVKAEQLSVLADYFQNSSNPDLANVSAEIESWWQTILELGSEESRKAAIWFSRYCFDQEETLTTLKLVFAAEKAIAESKKKAKNQAVKQNESESRSPTEYAHVPQPQSDRDARTNSYYADTNTAPATTKSSSAKINLLVPIIHW